MRYAIISDIHANLQAWEALQADLASLRVDCVISLGDLVGYGPNPVEVCEAAIPRVHYHLLGNHDAAACGKLDLESWNPRAREIIEWTSARLPGEVLTGFGKLSLSLSDGRFRCTHGEFSMPGCFFYIKTPEHALRSWNAVAEQLLFVGHTHRPALFVLGASGRPHPVAPQPFVLEDGKRYLVNVGSVGCPRDGDVKASYCVYDTTGQTVEWRRVPFDLAAYRAALRAADISDEPSAFLQIDPEATAQPRGTLRCRNEDVRLPPG
jgi:predicted phosphodiesterase